MAARDGCRDLPHRIPAVSAPATPADSPLTMKDALASPLYRSLSTAELTVGDPAVPFELPQLDPSSHGPTGATVRLADFAGERPVALVFGSYT